jgi:hypothetical protein
VLASSSSMAWMWEMLWRRWWVLRQAYPPIDTWSYCPAEVEIESEDAGFVSCLDSESRAAVVSWWGEAYIVLS